MTKHASILAATALAGLLAAGSTMAQPAATGVMKRDDHMASGAMGAAKPADSMTTAKPMKSKRATKTPAAKATAAKSTDAMSSGAMSSGAMSSGAMSSSAVSTGAMSTPRK